jgi:NADH-quinone oxidoreductase subunit G
LQDYHYDYNAKPSRFNEEDKEHKVKALPLGPNVILDGERCIMCTRCIRFCDEVTKTSELGMINRGDRSVIAISPGRELNNELSGTVVDLCPVGALTHRKWRFNTRIWYTKQTDSICPGCSTGCNVKVAIRDGQVVQVKARLNEKVNQEWLCDEGRYGFERFLPKNRLSGITTKSNPSSSLEEVAKVLKKFKEKKAVVFIAPDLLLEEYYVLKIFIEQIAPNATVAVAYTERELNKVQKVLVSPDYAANYQ